VQVACSAAQALIAKARRHRIFVPAVEYMN
jgi:hypothetical protein